MNRTSRSSSEVRIAARSPARSMAGPDAYLTLTPSSRAMIVARVVLPRPGGPYRRTWSAASPLPLAAWSSTDRLALTSRCPMYSSRVRGRRVPSMTTSPSSSRSAERMRERSSAIRPESSMARARFARMFDTCGSPTTRLGIPARMRGCGSPDAPNTAFVPSSTSSVTRTTARSRWPPWPSGTGCRRSSSSRSWPASSTPGSCGRPSGRTAATRIAADPATVSVGRVIRLLDGALAPLGCVSLRYYEPCSCVEEATCPLRDVMLDVRDAMLEILDQETLADLAARPGPGLDRPARPPRRRARRPETLTERQSPGSATDARRIRSTGAPVALWVEQVRLHEVDDDRRVESDLDRPGADEGELHDHTLDRLLRADEVEDEVAPASRRPGDP